MEEESANDVKACQELGIFLGMDDPTRIKNSMGLTRGKNDAIDAARIAEYAYRYSDKVCLKKMLFTRASNP